MDNLYHNPKYYEIAYSYRNIDAELDVVDDLIRVYSRIPAKRILEVACGPAAHLPELNRRGYVYVGLDLSPSMLAYSRDRAQTLQASASFVEADMRNFRLSQTVDFAFVLLGSLYVQTQAELIAHFDAMGRALKPGGLYLLDWCVNFAPLEGRHDTWTLAQDAVTVTTSYRATGVNTVAQTIEEDITLAVQASDRQFTLRDVSVRRAIYPQEFLLFVDQHPDFEFIGWWNRWNLAQPIEGTEAIHRPITVVRRV